MQFSRPLASAYVLAVACDPVGTVDERRVAPAAAAHDVRAPAIVARAVARVDAVGARAARESVAPAVVAEAVAPQAAVEQIVDAGRTGGAADEPQVVGGRVAAEPAVASSATTAS